MDEDLAKHLKDKCAIVDAALHRYLPPAETRPPTIHEAMRYSMFAGGKRLRPILCLEAAEACGSPGNHIEAAIVPGVAVECIHTYSLIHDDLPCMDDDDLRRGLPTCHVKYGEGIAVLAGDALLTLAFDVLADTKLPNGCRYGISDLIKELAVSAGSRHLVGGQVLDLEGEGENATITAEDLKYIHLSKTAALLTTSLRLGAMTANADASQLAALSEFGTNLGLAFQVIDDILDVTQSSEHLGKSAGKDAAVAKSTYPALFGLEKSKEEATRLTTMAHDALTPFGKKGDRLHQIADYLLARDF